MLKDGEKNQYNKVVAILLDVSNSLFLSGEKVGHVHYFVLPDRAATPANENLDSPDPFGVHKPAAPH
jgi:hypothetical protein